MIYIPAIVGFLAAFVVYKRAVASDKDPNTLSTRELAQRRESHERVTSLVLGLPVAGVAVSVLLWLGPDGLAAMVGDVWTERCTR